MGVAVGGMGVAVSVGITEVCSKGIWLDAVISDLSELLHADIVRNVVSREINNDL